MSKETINYNILSLLLSDCKYSSNYKVVSLESNLVFIEKNNKVKFPFYFNQLEYQLATGGNKKLSNYIESKFEELINLPY